MSVRHASRSIVDALPLSRPSTYVCNSCKQSLKTHQTLQQRRHYASEGSEGLPFAEKVRRKLWKGKPPGPENVDDLYGGPGQIETMFKNRRERRKQPAEDTQPSESKPTLKPIARSTAVRDQVPEVDQSEVVEQKVPAAPAKRKIAPSYKAATTWDGLALMGHKGHWKEMPVKPQDEYTSWLESPVKQHWTFDELTSLMHQAIVECYACRQSEIGLRHLAGLSARSPIAITELQNARLTFSDDSIDGVESIEKISREAFKNSSFRAAPEHPATYTQEEEAEIIARTGPILTPLEPRLLYTPTDTSFLDTKLTFTNVNFQIIKRFSRLINTAIPDPILTRLLGRETTKNTIRGFLTEMTEHVAAKPANLAEVLAADELLAAQSNLLVLGRRETPVDKEKELGRWKVIESELKARGLPVLGKLPARR